MLYNKSKKIIALVLALCFAVSLLLPVGFILVNTNHTHICCSGEYSGNNRVNSMTSICCVTCISINIKKMFIATLAYFSNANVFSLFLCLLAIYLFWGNVLSHKGFSSPVSLKVRMNN